MGDNLRYYTSRVPYSISWPATTTTAANNSTSWPATTTTAATNSTASCQSQGAGTIHFYNTTSPSITYSDWGKYAYAYENPRHNKLVRDGEYELPDGARLLIDSDGNYQICDQAAQVTYKANRIRDFSPHLNASDMLADFIRYVASVGVKRQDVMQLPLQLFAAWLVIEAAQRDGDDVPADIVPVDRDPLVLSAVRPKCELCGRFIPRLHYRHRFPFCSPEHAAKRLSLQSVS